MVEEVFAQAEHDVLADPSEPAHEGCLKHPRAGVDREVYEHVEPEA